MLYFVNVFGALLHAYIYGTNGMIMCFTGVMLTEYGTDIIRHDYNYYTHKHQHTAVHASTPEC